MSEPLLLRGAAAVDDRGDVGFVNDFDFSGVKRFYMVRNHRSGFIRAWHGHKREAKFVMAVSGAALVCAVKIDNWEAPSRDAQVHRFVLSERTPAILAIPAGYANGFMSLTEDARLMFFSTSTLAESQGDDIRFEARYWNPWTVEER
jgi:dTDP-4-dehydrorhamnose 3,5-epimerase